MFVDASALVALAAEEDEHHRAAKSFFSSLEPGVPLLTSTDVFDETVTRLRRKVSHATAVQTGRGLLASAVVRMVAVEPTDRDAAWALFCERADVPLSFTDCTTVVLMDRLGIRRIFTFDGDFEAFELQVVPRKARR